MERKYNSRKIYAFYFRSFFFPTLACVLTALHCTGHFQDSNKEEGYEKSWDKPDIFFYSRTQSIILGIERKPLSIFNSNSNRHILYVVAKEPANKIITTHLPVLPVSLNKTQNTNSAVSSEPDKVVVYRNGNTSCCTRANKKKIISESRLGILFQDKLNKFCNRKSSTNNIVWNNSLWMLYTKPSSSFTKKKFIDHAFYGEYSNFINSYDSEKRPNKNKTNNLAKHRLGKSAFDIDSVSNNSNIFNTKIHRVNRILDKNMPPPNNYNYVGNILSYDHGRSINKKIKKKRVIRQVNSWRNQPYIWNGPKYQIATSKDSIPYALSPKKMSSYGFRQVPAFALRDGSTFDNNFHIKISPDNFIKSFYNMINSGTSNKLLQSNLMPSFGTANQMDGECFLYQFMCLWLTEAMESHMNGNCQCSMPTPTVIPVYIPPMVITLTPPQIPTIVFTWWFSILTTPSCLRYTTAPCIPQFITTYLTTQTCSTNLPATCTIPTQPCITTCSTPMPTYTPCNIVTTPTCETKSSVTSIKTSPSTIGVQTCYPITCAPSSTLSFMTTCFAVTTSTAVTQSTCFTKTCSATTPSTPRNETSSTHCTETHTTPCTETYSTEKPCSTEKTLTCSTETGSATITSTPTEMHSTPSTHTRFFTKQSTHSETYSNTYSTTTETTSTPSESTPFTSK